MASTTAGSAAPPAKKRQISPPEADLSESAKKAKIAATATASGSIARPFAVTDEFETEAKTAVAGSVGLGGGEAEGLILSHQVSVSFTDPSSVGDWNCWARQTGNGDE